MIFQLIFVKNVIENQYIVFVRFVELKIINFIFAGPVIKLKIKKNVNNMVII